MGQSTTRAHTTTRSSVSTTSNTITTTITITPTLSLQHLRSSPGTSFTPRTRRQSLSVAESLFADLLCPSSPPLPNPNLRTHFINASLAHSAAPFSSALRSLKSRKSPRSLRCVCAIDARPATAARALSASAAHRRTPPPRLRSPNKHFQFVLCAAHAFCVCHCRRAKSVFVCVQMASHALRIPIWRCHRHLQQ